MDPSKEQSKEKNEQNFIYKSCTTRSDRDAYRICPSKLTKRELEDLYFTVLEENMEQKKTINGQQDKIKTLTSKVHRMFSAQKVHQADERKECCVSKCMMDQHKQSLLDLKRTNERMAERIRQLNQQLISAKQISKSRLLCAPKCPRSSPASPSLAEDLSTKSVETQTDTPSISQECDENKCRTLMDELKQKIANLEEELVNTHNEYSNRLSRLELEISQFRNQETLIRRGYVLTPELQQDLNRPETDDETNEPDNISNLKKELLIEKAKVIELANQLKSTETGSPSKTSENNLPTIEEQTSEESKECEGFLWDCNCIPVCPHSKPVCTVLRLFNKGSLCSAKHTCSVAIKTTNKINGLVTDGSQGSTNNHRPENEPNGINQKDLPEPMLKDSINFDGTNASNVTNKFKDKPKVEQKSKSDDNDRQAKRHVDNLENNLVIEPKDNGISVHKNTTVGADTLPGIEYKDLPDEKPLQNAIDARNYSNIGDVTQDKAIHDDIPKNGIISNNLSEVPNAQDVQSQDSTYLNKTQIISTIKEDQSARTSFDMNVDKNVPKLNEIQDQSHSKSAPNYNRQRLSGDNKLDQAISDQQNPPGTKIETSLLDNAEHEGSNRHRNSDSYKKHKEYGRGKLVGDKSQPMNNRNGIIDDTNRRIEERSQYNNGKDTRVDDRNQRINDRNQLIDERNQPVIDRNQHVDRRTPLADNKGQLIDNDKRKRSGDSGKHGATLDNNKCRTESIGSINVNLPETRFQREPGPDTSKQINFYHKCGCLTTRTPDTTDANICTDRERLLDTNGNRGSIEPDIRNVPVYDSNQVYPFTKGAQNQTNLINSEKYRNGTQHDASTSPYLPDTCNTEGLTEADLIPNKNRQNLPYAYEPHHQISSNEGQDEAPFQPDNYRNLNVIDTQQNKSPNNANINHKTHTQPGYKNVQNLPYGVQNQVSYNIDKDRVEPKPDGRKNRNLVDRTQSQGRPDAAMNYKNEHDLSNIYGPQNEVRSNIGQEKETLTGASKNLYLPTTNQVQGKTEADMNRNTPIYKNSQDLHYASGPNNQVSSNERQETVQTQSGVSRNLNLPVTNQIHGGSEKTMSHNIPAYKNGQELPYAHGIQNKINSNLDQDVVPPRPNVVNVPHTNLTQNLTETYTPAYKDGQDLPYAYEPQNQISSVIEQDKTQHDDKRNLNSPAANQFQGETETNINRNIPSYKNGQDLPFVYQGQNQISSKRIQDKAQTQPGAKINPNVPDTADQFQSVTEANIPAYQNAKDIPYAYGAPNQSSNIGQNRGQIQLDNKENVKLYDSNQGQGQIKADLISNIPAYKKGNDLPHTYEESNQINYNKRQDTAETQLDNEGYLNLPINGGDLTRNIPAYKNGKKNPATSDAQNQSESVKNNYQNLTDNRNQRLPEANRAYNNNHRTSEDGRVQNVSDLNLKKYNGQAKLDSRNQDVAVADSYISNTSHGPNFSDSIKMHDVETQTDGDGNIEELEPYSIKDPFVLAKNLTDISEAQLETIAELGRQFDAKKGVPVENDEINKNTGENSKANEVDSNDLSLNKENAFSKNDYTPTKVPAKNRTENSFSKKLPRDSIWLSKQKLNHENSEKNKNNGIKTKNDQHNSLQIPGPIPSGSTQNNSWKANVLKRFNRDPKKRNTKESNKKTKETASNTVNREEKGKDHGETSESDKDKDVYKSLEMSEKVIKLGYKERVSRHDGLNSPTKRMTDSETKMDPGALMVKCMELSMMQAAETLEEGIQSEPIPESVVSSKHDVKDDVPMPTQRELKTYRNEDGTLCFETKPVTDRSRCCQCDRKIHCQDYRSRDKQQEGKHRQIGTYEEGTSTTYSGDDAQCMALPKEDYRLYDTLPAPSVENDKTTKKRLSASSNKADFNIFHEEMPPITESPTENKYESVEPESRNVPEPEAYESKKFSGQKRLSIDVGTKDKPPSVPVEDTTTISKRDSTTVSDPNTLPEGKMLFTDDQPTATATEVKKDIDTTRSKSQSLLRMEEKLQALTEEIEHCKKMLFGQQPPDVKLQEVEHFVEESIAEENKGSKSALSELDEEERQLALKRGVAMHTIGDTFTPRCVFTLHVGTIVLSDEAVLTTRDKSLILSWKFYNQNVSITRMSAGRVMLFDISSEYDVQITDEFLEYMKFEEMIISICELTNQNEAFATCALPLRDALLHTNRRADMSLELVAGPQMLYARDANQTSDSLDTGDEVGVIDLWCMLRVDSKLLPMIKKAMANPTMTPRKKKEEPRIKPLIDDDDDDDDKNRTRSDSQKFDESFQDMREMDTKKLHRWGSSILRLPSRDWSQPTEYGEPKHRKSSGKRESAGSSKVKDSLSSLKLFAKKRHKQFATQPETKKQKHNRKGSADIGTQVSYTSVTAQYDPSKYPLPRVDSRLPLNENKEKERLGHQSGILINEVIANIKTPEDMKHAMENTYRHSIHKVSRLPRNEDDIVSQAHSGSTFNFIRSWKNKRSSDKGDKSSYKSSLTGSNKVREYSRDQDFQPPLVMAEEEPSDIELINRKYDNISKIYSSRPDTKKQVTINANNRYADDLKEEPQKDEADYADENDNMKFINQKVDITILWLALNEECEAMCNPKVQRVYVAYNFLGRSGADLETPFSLPKPKHHVDKCYFNFKKSFQVEEEDVSLLGHMARCRAASRVATDIKDCVVFSVISEPPEDPLGLDTCEDIGYAYLYLGDLLAYSAGSAGYTEVVPVRARGGSSVCGVLAVRLDGLDVLRRCATLTAREFVPTIE